MPAFTDPHAFPTFQELPSSTATTTTTTSLPSTPPAPDNTWFLLAQIRENMTITKPTLVVRDRAGLDFAVTFDDGDHRGLPLSSPSSSSSSSPPRFRRGHTLVVPRATRTDREGEGEGRGNNNKKKAVVRVPAGQSGGVRVIPGGLEQVVEMGRVVDGMQQGADAKKCAACGEAEGEGEGEGQGEGQGKGKVLMRCTGCGVAAYCSKACQARGWSEMGHKSNCKVVKSIKEIWP
ncbi:hypothetical protein GGR53DRAFT_466942 [Hypoxylon sp. FL1150]|nr:hypothetical protein GGR53DRAFT_466942 [Hypoxylon sp. FL1150]